MTAVERANLRAETELAYRRALFLTNVARLASDHWKHHGDVFGLELVAELLDRSAALLEKVRTVPEDEAWTRDLAKNDREHAELTRTFVSAFRGHEFVAIGRLSGDLKTSVTARSKFVRDGLSRLAPRQTRPPRQN